MPCYYEEINGKRDFFIVINKKDAKDLKDLVLPLELFEKGISKKLDVKCFLEVGRTKFAEIDRRYYPKFGLPLSETDKICFVLENSLYPKFRKDEVLISKFPNGDVTLQIGEADF
ncbi:MAG: hypothetical protein KKF67_01135 [Nanoarchaeota archaeon]|nr:hypothetical protein [Nanoarchaeota archaeon]